MSPDVLLECPRTSFRDVLRVNVTERVWHSPPPVSVRLRGHIGESFSPREKKANEGERESRLLHEVNLVGQVFQVGEFGQVNQIGEKKRGKGKRQWKEMLIVR